ncbi:MAG: site-specific integrase [Dysosmobacter sp.]
MTRETQRFMEVSALYLRDCRITASKTTIDNRSRTLSMFLKSLDENGDDPDVLGVMNWKSGMAERGLKKSSMRQYLSELHEFFRWAVEHGFYESNPVKRSDIPRAGSSHTTS